MSEKYDPEASAINKQLVIRALTDPDFRQKLEEAPERVLGERADEITVREIGFVLAAVKGIEAQISALADQLLCVTGDPCGIAVT